MTAITTSSRTDTMETVKYQLQKMPSNAPLKPKMPCRIKLLSALKAYADKDAAAMPTSENHTVLREMVASAIRRKSPETAWAAKTTWP